MEYDKSTFPLYHITTEPVITLRDWFAGLAMMAIISKTSESTLIESSVVERACEYADAMLKEREKLEKDEN